MINKYEMGTVGEGGTSSDRKGFLTTGGQVSGFDKRDRSTPGLASDGISEIII